MTPFSSEARLLLRQIHLKNVLSYGPESQPLALGVQLIVATHSDILVDALTDHPETIVVCEKERGCTVARRLNAAELEPWLQKYRLGDLWTRGEIGGTRW